MRQIASSQTKTVSDGNTVNSLHNATYGHANKNLWTWARAVLWPHSCVLFFINQTANNYIFCFVTHFPHTFWMQTSHTLNFCIEHQAFFFCAWWRPRSVYNSLSELPRHTNAQRKADVESKKERWQEAIWTASHFSLLLREAEFSSACIQRNQKAANKTRVTKANANKEGHFLTYFFHCALCKLHIAAVLLFLGFHCCPVQTFHCLVHYNVE